MAARQRQTFYPLRLYGLVDGLPYAGALFRSGSCVALFDGTPYRALANTGPSLLDCTGDRDSHRASLHRLGDSATGCLWIVSGYSQSLCSSRQALAREKKWRLGQVDEPAAIDRADHHMGYYTSDRQRLIDMLRILSLSGSLRFASSNTHALVAATMLAPHGVVIENYNEIGELPHFNPDLEDKLPARIVDLRTRVNEADGLLIACPEYARGIPGAFKNMLDWLVGSPDFPGKPVALLNTSPRASAAQAALKLVLETMSARLIPEACATLELLGKQTDAVAIANDPVSREILRKALEAIVDHVLTASSEAPQMQR